MPSFARELEQTLHNALGEASKRRHEYATLEHLLIALIDDEHASKVMSACGVNREELRATVKQYLDAELGALVADSGTDIDEDKLLDFCAAHLAGFKRPRTIDIVPSLPRNATGKILKRDLRAPHWAGRSRSV